MRDPILTQAIIPAQVIPGQAGRRVLHLVLSQPGNTQPHVQGLVLFQLNGPVLATPPTMLIFLHIHPAYSCLWPPFRANLLTFDGNSFRTYTKGRYAAAICAAIIALGDRCRRCNHTCTSPIWIRRHSSLASKPYQ